MTDNQTRAREQLTVIRNFQRTLQIKRDKIDALKLSAGSSAIRYDKEPVQTTPDNFTEKVLIDAVDLEAEIEEDIASMESIKRYVYDAIQRMDNMEEQNLLIFYYYDNLSYYETSQRLHMSERNIYRMEDDALEHLGILLDSVMVCQ